MRAYAKGVLDLQCELPGTPKEKLPKVSAPCLFESRIKGSWKRRRSAGVGRILKRCLWLFATCKTRLEFRCTNPGKEVDALEGRQKIRLRLTSYLHGTSDSAMKAGSPCTAKSRSDTHVLHARRYFYPISWPSKKQFSTAGKASQAAELIAPANPPFHPSKGLRHTQNCRNIDGGFSAVNQDNQAATAVIRAGSSAHSVFHEQLTCESGRLGC